MPHLFWFLVGVLAGGAAALLLWTRRRQQPGGDVLDGPVHAPALVTDLDTEPTHDRLTRRLVEETRREVETVAHSLGSEIASLASAIEGHAELLREASLADSHAERSLVVHRGDHLAGSVRRLRHCSHKILSFAHVDDLPVGRLAVTDLLDEVISEIEDWGTHYRVELYTSEFLPDVQGNRHALRNAVLFLVETLLGLDSRASRLSIRAFAKVYEHQDTRVVLEISAEADESGCRHEASRAAIQLGYVAARNLLEAQGARLSFDELEGLSVTCFVSLLAAQPAASTVPTYADRDLDLGEFDLDEFGAGESGGSARNDVDLLEPEPAAGEALLDRPAPATAKPTRVLPTRVLPTRALPTRPAPQPASRHSFGGVLVLEDDPALREMIAVEFQQSGRKLVSCVDGAAARSLIEATPERFELAILEQGARIEPGTAIARLLKQRCPDARIVLLTTASDSAAERHRIDALELRKPFRMHDLRSTLRAALEPAHGAG